MVPWWMRKINWNGHPKIRGNWRLKRVIRYALYKYDVYITSTSDGVHSPTSYHYSGQAVDFGSNRHTPKVRLHRGLYKKFKKKGWFAELFGPVNKLFVKNNVRYTIREGDGLESSHDNHVHVAIRR